MNKRQKKKSILRDMREEWELICKIGSCFPENIWTTRYDALRHPRRRWLSVDAHKQAQRQFKADQEAERAKLREMQKTQVFTLGGWIPKEEWGKR